MVSLSPPRLRPNPGGWAVQPTSKGSSEERNTKQSGSPFAVYRLCFNLTWPWLWLWPWAFSHGLMHAMCRVALRFRLAPLACKSPSRISASLGGPIPPPCRRVISGATRHFPAATEVIGRDLSFFSFQPWRADHWD